MLTLKTKKSEIDQFEDEMNNELNNLITAQQNKFISNHDDEQINMDTQTNNEDDMDTDSEAELETGIKTKVKRIQYTNDELFYDPQMDDEDQDWINRQRETCELIKKSDTAPLKKNENKLKSILKTKNEKKSATTTVQFDQKFEQKYTDAQTDAVLK
jgi:hypothetical protein